MCLGPMPTPEQQRQIRAVRCGTLATIAALLEGEPDVPASWAPREPLVTTAGSQPVDGWGRWGHDWAAEVAFRTDWRCWQWRAWVRIDGKVERTSSTYDAQRPLVSRAEAFRQADEWIAERGMA